MELHCYVFRVMGLYKYRDELTGHSYCNASNSQSLFCKKGFDNMTLFNEFACKLTTMH